MLLSVAIYTFVGLSWSLVYLRLWRRAQRRVIPPCHPLLTLQDASDRPTGLRHHAPEPVRPGIVRLRLVPKG